MPPKRATLYVTEWVIARGILVVEGELCTFPAHKTWYWLDLPHEKSHRLRKWALGVSVFFTLEEAQADAEARWEEHAEQAWKQAERAQEGLRRFRNGELQVHEVSQKIACYTAFDVEENDG